MVSPGGDGSPELREYAVPELAMARETHALTTRALIADALDLVHRLPRTWARVRAGECEPWVARKAAVLSRELPAEQIGLVDRAVARAIGRHAPATVLEIVRGKVVEADPVTHANKRELSRHQRYVSLSRADEFGYRHVIARVTAGDAAWIDAMVDRVTDILLPTRGHDHNRDELRSEAMGWLARPADLLQLLLEHTATSTDDEKGAREESVQPTAPVWAPPHLAVTAERLSTMSARQLASLRGRGQLFVHVTDETLRTGHGVARIEGVGPIQVAQLAEVLGHADVTVTPVVDHRLRPRSDAYEHPEIVKDQVWTLSGGDCFPFSPRRATRAGVDFDHAVPYDPNGPPGQTGTHNSGPLRRRHHRWKTHGGYRTRIAGPGRHLRQTPHGLVYLVDQDGTRRLDPSDAEIMVTAPEGVEMYCGPRVVDGLS